MKIKQLYIDKYEINNNTNIFQEMGFSSSQSFKQISFLIPKYFLQQKNGITYINNYFIILTNENVSNKIFLGEFGILELENITLTQIQADPSIPCLNIMYSYE